MLQMLSLLLKLLILLFPGRHFFGVFLVKMTALLVIMTAGKPTALKSVFIALPLSSTCEMLGSRENATNKFRVVFTPPRLLCTIFRDDFLLDNLASGNLEAGVVGRSEIGTLA